MAVPLIEGTQGGDHQAGIRGSLLELQRLPARQGALNRAAFDGRARRAPQQRERAVTVMREIGVNTNPIAVAAAVNAGDLVPAVRLHTIHGEIAARFLCRMAHIDGHPLAATTAHVPDFAGGQRRRAHAALGGHAHGKRRGKNGIGARQIDVAERLFRHIGHLP